MQNDKHNQICMILWILSHLWHIVIAQLLLPNLFECWYFNDLSTRLSLSDT